MSSPVLPRQYEPLRAAAYKRGFAEGKASALGVAGKIGLTPIESSSTGHVLATTVYLQPDHTITGRAFEIGPLEVRKRIVAKFTATEAAKRHETLVRQIAVAQQKITASEDVLRRVQAARELLEGNPVEDFAAKLREVEGQAAAATTALAAAKLDHNALTKLVPRHFTEAADTLTQITSAEVASHVADLAAKSDAAQQAKAEAIDKLREAVQAAFSTIYAGPASEAALYQTAHSRTADTETTLSEKLVGELLGSVPPGVAMLRSRTGSLVIQDAPPPRPVPMDQVTKLAMWNQFLDRLAPLAERTEIRFQRNPTSMGITWNGRGFLLSLDHWEQTTPNATIILEEPGKPITKPCVVQFNSLGQTAGSGDVNGLLLPEQSEDLLLHMLPM